MLRRLFTAFAYLLLAIIIVGGTFVLVAVGKGYGYDFAHNRVVYNGLIILGSAPQGGDIKINGKTIHHKTPYRTTLEAGTYDVEVTKTGYRPWSKRLIIPASGLTWAEYILFFPLELKPQPLMPTAPVAALAQTRDRRHIAYVTTTTDSGVWALSADGRQTTKIYTPKLATVDLPAETIDSLQWSDDGSHLLMRSVIGPKISYLLVAASANGTVTNLTDVFGFNFAALRFNPANWRELYWISPEGLRRVSVDSQTVSAVLAEKVSNYIFGADKVIYVQTTALGKSVWSLDSGGHKQELIQSLPESDSYEMEYRNYQGKDVLAIAPNLTNTVTIYLDLFSSNLVTKVVSKSANHLSFSDDGHYLVYYSGTEYGAYDLDRDTIGVANQFDGPLTTIGWFDNYHLLINTSGKLLMSEYDGANSIQLETKAGANLPAFGTSDGKRIIWTRLDPAGAAMYVLDIKR